MRRLSAAHARELILLWVTGRERVRLARAAGAPPPWTDDPVLRAYRFCNVVRVEDRVSQWLLTHWYGPHRGHPHTLVAAALARFLNRPETLAPLTEKVYADGGPDWGGIKARLRAMREGGATIFNAAYMVRGNDGPDKVVSVVDHNVRPLLTPPVAVDTASMRRTWEALVPRHGFGSFMAGQVVADLRWALPGEWADRKVWAPEGPGSKQGLNFWLGRPPSAAFRRNEFVGRLREYMDWLYPRLPAALASRMEAIDAQNTLCEAAKYIKAILGVRMPKRRYAPPVPQEAAPCQ